MVVIARGSNFRTREEVQEVRAKQDPIGQLKEKLIGSGLSDADELKVRIYEGSDTDNNTT